ncbi:electron transfer flavoprotein subunit beta/FixA family protein [Corynebacterium flavescens]|uniref:electron transfer flavoprotein subunit beta/FixA family protein n=1 Tax=Corynebacterium flavescens TaxID=28028 RepID=UPI00289D648F|nr:electron transfer flavoprotein subunit beta/FixA family protein [Corynebacterium flavescens]
MPAIVALVKHVPDTWSTKSLEADYTLDRVSVDNVIDEINEYSVEQALRLRDDNPEAGFRVIALTMGPAAAADALRKALAMGADDAVHILDDSLAGSDALSTAWTLNAAINTIEDVAIITMGNAASDSYTGLLAGLLSEYRQIPALTEMQSLTLEGQTLRGVRVDSRGRFELQANLPAIASVTDKADKPRFPNFKGLMAAKKAEITTVDLASLGISAVAPTTTVVEASRRPERTAGELITDPNPVAAASQIVDFLAAKNLI